METAKNESTVDFFHTLFMTTYFYYNHEFLLGNPILSTFGLRRKSIAKFLEHLYIKNQHGDGR